MSLTPTQRRSTRYKIRRYCERSEVAKQAIHYSQNRPMTHLGDAPESGYTADCSGFVTGAFYWADKWSSWKVADPNGLKYSGYGYTGTLAYENRKRRVPYGRKYFIGDIALYGPNWSDTKHTVVCRKGGYADAAIWTSHGSEAGPYSIRLHYRRDLLGVVRPEALA